MALTFHPSHPLPHTATTAVFQTTFFLQVSPNLMGQQLHCPSVVWGGGEGSSCNQTQTRLVPWSWPSHLQLGRNTSLLLIGHQVSGGCTCPCCRTLLQISLMWAHLWANSMARPTSGKIPSHKDLKTLCDGVRKWGLRPRRCSTHEGSSLSETQPLPSSLRRWAWTPGTGERPSPTSSAPGSQTFSLQNVKNNLFRSHPKYQNGVLL